MSPKFQVLKMMFYLAVLVELETQSTKRSAIKFHF